MTRDREGPASYERSFVLAVPKDRAWGCFTQPAERNAWLAAPDPGTEDHYTTAGGTAGFSVVIEQVVPLELLRWTEVHTEPEGKIEICVIFDDADSGTRITITQSRFGDIDDAHWQASHRGWDEAISDLAFYLRTGIAVRRHFSDRGATGIMSYETLAGVEVATVFPDGFGAEVGLEPGDLLLEIDGSPIFTMAEIWSVLRRHRPEDKVPISFVRGQELRTGIGTLSSPRDFPSSGLPPVGGCRAVGRSHRD